MAPLAVQYSTPAPTGVWVAPPVAPPTPEIVSPVLSTPAPTTWDAPEPERVVVPLPPIVPTKREQQLDQAAAIRTTPPTPPPKPFVGPKPPEPPGILRGQIRTADAGVVVGPQLPGAAAGTETEIE